MKHLGLAAMAGIAAAALVSMVTLVTAAVKPVPLIPTSGTPVIATTPAVDKDTDPIEHVLVLGVYLASDASQVEHFTYQELFPSRHACQKRQEDEEFQNSLKMFLVQQTLVKGPIGWTIRCMTKGSPA